MRLLAVFLIVSLAVHLGLFAIPLPEKKIEKKEVIPVSIVDYKLQEQKKEPIKNQRQQKFAEKKPEPKKNVKKETIKEANKNTDNEVSKKTDTNTRQVENKPVQEKPFRPKGADDPLILPDIKVPLTPSEVIPEIAVPDIPKPNIDIMEDMVENKKNMDISKELSSLSAAQREMQAENSVNELQKETETAENIIKGSIYNFDIAPAGNRKVIYLPPDPVFALANDTKVTVRFSIDKSGNTFNTVFITRSSTDVEKMALEYISRMKFDAIIEDREDFAQITMHFKVQK